METRKRFTRVAAYLCALLLGGGTAQATDICGVVPATLVIFENSQLVCDVQCTMVAGPCIQFGASGIKLALNGYTMTGSADPPTNCPGPNTHGISSAGLTDIVIEGPGLVQKFGRHGIFLFQNNKATVKKVTSHQHCLSGLQMVETTNSLVEELVSVRNASFSGTAPCGGICISFSHNNRIRRSEFSGNGSVVAGAPGGFPNDFGVGLTGDSDGNVIEENAITGNVNGIQIFPEAGGNVIRKNVITGNPHIQLGSPPAVGSDVRDYSPPGANTFDENLCISYNGVTPPPAGPKHTCPHIPSWAGHQNN